MEAVEEHVLDGTPPDIITRYESLPSVAEVSDFGVLDSNVVVIDTETTGLSFSHDELIQIAAARLENGRISDWYVTFVNPGKPIPEEIVHLTGIADEDVADAPGVEEALQGLVSFAGDAVMVAHNATFDKTFVTKHPVGYPLLENIWVDSLELSRIALPRLKSHRLIDLVHAFGAPVSTHRADDDVAATCVVYRILVSGICAMPESLVQAIADMASVGDWPTSFVFKVVADENRQIARPLSEGNVDTHTDDPGVSRETPHEAFAFKSQCIHDTEPEIKHGSREIGDKCIDDTMYQMQGSPEASSKGVSEQNAPEGQQSIPGLEGAVPARPKHLFSLHALRRRRITTLPTRFARKDADDLAGTLQYPGEDEIDAAFSSGGLLGAIYGDYEPRDEQRQMAQAIRQTFETSENLAIEAGTGVGKSMAYLVPAVKFAKRNGVAVGLATKTNSLLDQLVYSELPSLAAALAQEDPHGEELTWAPLKGMSHYLCLRKVSRLVENGPRIREVAGQPKHQAPSLAAALSYVEQTEFDDIDSLKMDYRALPRYQVTTTSSECLRRKCPFFGKLCYVHGARRRAEMADVIVTNHSLLFCDLAADGGLLPTVRHWIVDEAHAAESEARSAFAQTVDSEAVSRIAHRVSDASGGSNVFSRAERSVEKADGEQLTLFFGLSAKAHAEGNSFAKVAGEYLDRVKDLLYFDPVQRNRKGQSYEQVDVWINADVRKSEVFGDVALTAHRLIEASDKLIKASSDLVAYLEGIDEAAVAQREIASCTMELRDIRNAAEIIFETAPENYAYQATLYRKRERKADKLQALPLDVGDKMNETIYARTHSVVYASATLTVGGKFDSFANAIGLNRGEFSTARTVELPSSYDFDNNMIVYVAKDMPEPSDPRYLEALNRLLIETHRAQKGSMLTLFTNRREMERSHAEVAAALKADDLRVVCQKYGVSVKGLRDDFLADEHLSLFALKSFWEGFDAPGATLKGVVIPKLPFARPTDPLYCERAARDDRAWWRYVLPQAVIETKQAAGRLIRKSDDHGVLILADRRLITKSYGKTFLNSLQSKTVRFSTVDEIAASLRMMSGW